MSFDWWRAHSAYLWLVPRLQLRVLDMQPEFAMLGNTFAEAAALQRSQVRQKAKVLKYMTE